MNEQQMIDRHQAALRALDRLENSVNFESPVIQAMASQAGPMATWNTRRPMATRIRPVSLVHDDLDSIDGYLSAAVKCLSIAAVVMAGIVAAQVML